MPQFNTTSNCSIGHWVSVLPRLCRGTSRLPGARRTCVALWTLTAIAMAAGLVGCEGERTQSALHPASPAAASVARLWWILLAVCGGYFLLVMLLLFIAIFRSSRQPAAPPRYGGRVFIITGGVAVPAIILVSFLFFSLQTTRALQTPESALTIQVNGHQWWWGIEYPDQDVITANEIHIPVGEPVALELTSADVIHSLWVPELQGKIDLLPWRTTSFWIEADRPGVFRGQCAEYCGLQHAHMALDVVALPPGEFAAWVAQRQTPIPEADPEEGHQVFLQAGCASCHTVRGTAASGKVGPDLTHIGSRRTIGAGLLRNNYGNLAGWVANPQAIKPGIEMPPTHLEPGELHLLVQYLTGLE